jgi:unsaturated chondroitin disaccharide hydrolase
MKASLICLVGSAATRLVVGRGLPARDFTEYTARRSPTPKSADIPVRQTRCEDLADKNVRAPAPLTILLRLAALCFLVLGNTLRADALTAADDQAQTTQNTSVSIAVLANDSDVEGNPLAILRVSAPAHGKVTINSGAVPASPELAGLLQFAALQLSNSVTQIADTNQFPRSTVITNGLWRTRSSGDWASGFFSGCLWLMYEQTKDPQFRQWAESWTGGITPQQFNPDTDDLGFMINSSFGNGYRLTTNADYKAVLLQAAQSVSNRFNAAVGGFGYWSGTTNAQYDTWLDSTMNMEMIFRVCALGGDTNFYSMAYSHEAKAMLNHVRADDSTYHIVHYDGNTGAVLGRGTYAGASDESTWARGHAWGTYAFTMAYRETGDLRFLNTAQRLADYYLTNVPPDYVPYWDYQYWEYQGPSATYPLRDSSAAAITLSALLELSQRVTNAVDAAEYWQAARRIFDSLSSTNYLAQGRLSSGILLHGVGETPPLWDQELDVSLIYGDYYFLEALKRYREIYNQTTVTYVPDTNFCGTDSFTYQVCDSGGECVTATVTVVVSPAATNVLAAQISLAPGTHLPTISFPTLTGQFYHVQYRDDLAAGPWSILATNLAGSGAALSVTDTNPAARRFYRVGSGL